MRKSLDFYCDRLGFVIAGKAEDDAGQVFWCHLERDGVSIMVERAEDEHGPMENRGRGVILYFECDDIDALHAEFVSRGLQLPAPAASYYGMKQVYLREPDGYELCFQSPVRD